MKKISKKTRNTILISGGIGAVIICLSVLFLIYTPSISDFVSGFTNRFPLNNTPDPETGKSENNATTDENNPTITGSEIPNEGGAYEENKAPANLDNLGLIISEIANIYNSQDNLQKAGNHKIVLENLEPFPGLKNGSITDIRIRFPNGEDYIVLKNVSLYINRNDDDTETMYLNLSENEILYLSSAIADQKKYRGVRIYAAAGLDMPEKTGGLGNYRPSKDILTLINEERLLDMIFVDEVFLARERLESRLLIYSSELIKEVEDDLLEGGLIGDTTNGYWIYN